jgi:hypothetical protein
VAWISNCEFTISYVSGTKAISKQELEFYKQSTLKLNITKTTKDYYTFDALFTYNNNTSKVSSDTMWFQEKKLAGIYSKRNITE